MLNIYFQILYYQAETSQPDGKIIEITIHHLKGNFAIFYMLAKYVPGDITYESFIDIFPQTKQIANLSFWDSSVV
jgi:hypothetical protein